MIKKFADQYKETGIKLSQNSYNKWKDVAIAIDKEMQHTNKSLAQLCDEHGVRYSNLYAFFKKYSTISISNKHNGTRENDIRGAKKRTKHTLNKQDIQNLYVNQNKSLSEVAKVHGCGKVTLFNFCKANNIPLRSSADGTRLYRSQMSPEEKARRNKIDVERGVNNYFNRRMYGTKPELHFKRWLEDNNIRYTEQYRKVGNGHPYDFFLNGRNLIVEIDGNYWHSKKDQRIKDKRYAQDAIDKGYDIIRINTKDVDYKVSDYSKWI
jgi:very-short-patch-repair endonuclease